MDEVIKILNKYRSEPLEAGWSPWTPICDNCGKIITPRVTEFDGRIVNMSARIMISKHLWLRAVATKAKMTR
jgi:lysyl-tRNA synthetase class I